MRRRYAATGSRLGDGLSSVFYHVLLWPTRKSCADKGIGTLADYIAMLSLSQIEKPGRLRCAAQYPEHARHRNVRKSQAR